MTVLDIAKQAEKLIRKNSPAILTAIGVSGTLSTAYLTGKASWQAARTLGEESPFLDRKEKVRLVWKYYIPATISGVATVGAIVGASRASSRRTAVLAAAYSVSETAFTEYKEKVVEQLGAKKEEAIRDDIAKDRVANNPPTLVITDGKVLCCELYTGRYFESSMESLKRAVNQINHELINYSGANLNDFYHLIGLPYTQNSALIGWSSDKLLELKFSTVMTPDQRPCIAFEYNYTKPI